MPKAVPIKTDGILATSSFSDLHHKTPQYLLQLLTRFTTNQTNNISKEDFICDMTVLFLQPSLVLEWPLVLSWGVSSLRYSGRELKN